MDIEISSFSDSWTVIDDMLITWTVLVVVIDDVVDLQVGIHCHRAKIPKSPFFQFLCPLTERTMSLFQKIRHLTIAANIGTFLCSGKCYIKETLFSCHRFLFAY